MLKEILWFSLTITTVMFFYLLVACLGFGENLQDYIIRYAIFGISLSIMTIVTELDPQNRYGANEEF
jgi:hypothetical protein